MVLTLAILVAPARRQTLVLTLDMVDMLWGLPRAVLCALRRVMWSPILVFILSQ